MLPVINQIRDEESFKRLVEKERTQKFMEDDDTTLLVIPIKKDLI